MKVKFFNRGLLNIIESRNIKEEDVKSVAIGESSIIIELKDGRKFCTYYTLTDDWYSLNLN